jgi:hypothetical protein
VTEKAWDVSPGCGKVPTYVYKLGLERFVGGRSAFEIIHDPEVYDEA